VGLTNNVSERRQSRAVIDTERLSLP
jgi:hypothetical protein